MRYLSLKGLGDIHIAKDTNQTIGAYSNGQFVGSLHFFDSKSSRRRLADNGIDVSDEQAVKELIDFGVKSGYRGKGIGSEMLKYLITLLEPRSVIVLDCFEERLDFYKRNGFKVVCREKNFKRKKCFFMRYDKSEGLD